VREYVFFEPALVNALSLTGTVASPPAPAPRRGARGEAAVTTVRVTTYGGGGEWGPAAPLTLELEGRGSVGTELAALEPGDPVTVNGHLEAAGGGATGLRVVVDAVWWVDPATLPPRAVGGAGAGGGGGGGGAAAGGEPPPLPPPPGSSGVPPRSGSAPPGGGAPAAAPAAPGAAGASSSARAPRAPPPPPPPPPQRRTPPPAALAAAFCSPGGSFVELAARYGVEPTSLLAKLLAAAAGGAPLDWGKLCHEAEQFATGGDGGAALADVAAFVDAWVSANPSAANRDGSPALRAVRAALLADVRLGPGLAAAEAAAGAAAAAEAGGGGSGARAQGGTYALINIALSARALGVRLY
jgi:hypothetical protein